MSPKATPLVSVIVPTYNSARFLSQCLASIKSQTYQNIELIIVDNNSVDETKSIANNFTQYVHNKGPERSAQVNYGVEKSNGLYVYKVDSDFVLEPTVIQECVDKVNKGFDAVIVHNSPDVTKSWIAKIRKFEVDMYKYDLTHSSARFVSKQAYLAIGGFNSAITAGEDYDFQNKLNRNEYKTGFIEGEALHLGEPTNILLHLKKFYVYGKDFVNYKEHNSVESKSQLKFRRSVYKKHKAQFIKHPALGTVFMLYNIMKYTAGGLGYISSKVATKRIQSK